MTVRNILWVSLLQIEYPGSRGQPAAPYPLMHRPPGGSMYAQSRASVPRRRRTVDRLRSIEIVAVAKRQRGASVAAQVPPRRCDAPLRCRVQRLPVKVAGFREARKNRGKDISKGARIPLRCNMLQCPCKTVAGYGTRKVCHKPSLPPLMGTSLIFDSRIFEPQLNGRRDFVHVLTALSGGANETLFDVEVVKDQLTQLTQWVGKRAAAYRPRARLGG